MVGAFGIPKQSYSLANQIFIGNKSDREPAVGGIVAIVTKHEIVALGDIKLARVVADGIVSQVENGMGGTPREGLALTFGVRELFGRKKPISSSPTATSLM